MFLPLPSLMLPEHTVSGTAQRFHTPILTRTNGLTLLPFRMLVILTENHLIQGTRSRKTNYLQMVRNQTKVKPVCFNTEIRWTLSHSQVLPIEPAMKGVDLHQQHIEAVNRNYPFNHKGRILWDRVEKFYGQGGSGIRNQKVRC